MLPVKRSNASRAPIFLRLATASAIFASIASATTVAQAQKSGEVFAFRVRQGKHPRLTVVISIDQFRADYLRRLTDLLLPAKLPGGKPGGFRSLMTNGSYFIDAHYDHYPTYTGPGHAVILSGAYPYKTGIVSNDWLIKKQASPFIV